MTRNIILFDDPAIHSSLLPLTFTRPISHLLIGLDTIKAKWQRLLPGKYSYHTSPYLSELFPTVEDTDNIVIYSHILPSPELASAIADLHPGHLLEDSNHQTIAFRGAPLSDLSTFPRLTFTDTIDTISRPYHIFSLNHKAIEVDFESITRQRTSLPIPDTCTVIGSRSLIFIEPGASVEGATLNTRQGPIYIGVNAQVMEGSCLRGPIAILNDATVNMGTKIYGATTIGAHCKVGGEINNVVFHPYSNKAHDGFLGNAVIGSWCNIGAGSVASNLKNDYTETKLWDYPSRRFLRTGLQFCGLIMADHSKAGINTMFNTATMLGVGVNIHGSGFPRNFVPSFSEGSASAGFTDVPLTKFFSIAQRVMARRDMELTQAHRRMFTAIHEIAETYK